jgi:hypothetical protein
MILTPGAMVRGFSSQTLDIAGQAPDVVDFQVGKRRHDGIGAGMARIDEMGHVPVIRMLSAFLRQIHAGPFRTQKNGPVRNIIAGLGNALGSPVYRADRLGVTVNASVGDINGPAFAFPGGAFPEGLRWRGVPGDIRPVDHHKGNGNKNDQRAGDYRSGRHVLSHTLAPGLIKSVRIML